MIWRTNYRFALVLLLTISGLLIANAGERTVAASEPANSATQVGNLLQNPGFEGGYQAWNGIPEIQVAANWTPWWREDPGHNPAYFRPEYKRALVYVFPRRVFSGESAQQWFTFHASHVAGMYQQVFNATPGQHYRFSIWAQVWSSVEDDPDHSVLPANPHLQIGIDPTGNWDPGAPTVIWSGEAPMSGVIDQWGLMAIEAAAENNVVTVYMRTNPDFANKHNDMYWDNASLEAVQPPMPTAPPSPTPGPATNTPQATTPPEATNTPTVTNTPSATPTATVSATTTATPTATSTSTPTSTPTPAPTDTPQPTNTPTPTEVSAISQQPTSDETDNSVTADIGGQDAEVDQPTAEGVADSDTLGIVALVAVGLAISLLAILIWVLLKGKRTRN